MDLIQNFLFFQVAKIMVKTDLCVVSQKGYKHKCFSV